MVSKSGLCFPGFSLTLMMEALPMPETSVNSYLKETTNKTQAWGDTILTLSLLIV
jgi:hypothetical protein